MDEEVVARSAGRLMSGKFTLEDFLEQLQQVRKLGSLGGIMKLLPGMSKEVRQAADQIDDSEVNRVEAIVRSMTPKERVQPQIVDGSRRLRIARGSGTSTQDVNQLLKQFREMQKMMKGMGSGSLPPGFGALGGKGVPGQGIPGQGIPGQGLPGGHPGGQRAGGLLGRMNDMRALQGAPEEGSPARWTPPSGGSSKGRPGSKKKKGGRVTPPKPR